MGKDRYFVSIIMDVNKIGMIGIGFMGGMMFFFLVDYNIYVYFYDFDCFNVKKFFF